MQAYFNEHPITYRELLNGDQCSQAYAVGMTGCNNAFVIEIGVIFGGVIIGWWSGAGILYISGGLSVSVAAAWAHLHSCQQGVVAAFRICREANPTH